MAALQSPGPETAGPQGIAVIPMESLVPLDTQLITPALAEAFELPYNVLSSDTGREVQPRDFQRELQNTGASKDMAGAKDYGPSAKDYGQGTKEYGQHNKDFGQGSGPNGVQMQQQPQAGIQQTAAMKQPPGDFNYQRSLYGNAQQPLLGNMFPQQSPSNLAPGNLPPSAPFPMEPQDHQLQGFLRQQAALSGPQMPPGYAGMSPQFNGWMDPAVPGPFNQTANPGKHPPEPNVGSDPDNDDYQARALKRPRLVWTLQLHQRFVDAVEQLGLKNAVPKTIMQLMNVDGLTRENVASHLQKYRLQLRKDGGKGDDMDKMVDEDPHKDLEPEQPRLTLSEGGFK